MVNDMDAATDSAPGHPLRVLFVCSGNSARSQFAEAILNRAGGDRFVGYSAGTKPRAALRPEAIAVLEANGHDPSALHPKSLGHFLAADAPALDVVLTVCDQVAKEECLLLPGLPLAAHWSIPRPSAAAAHSEDGLRPYHDTYRLLDGLLHRFLALPLDRRETLALKQALDAIGREAPGANAKLPH